MTNWLGGRSNHGPFREDQQIVLPLAQFNPHSRVDSSLSEMVEQERLRPRCRRHDGTGRGSRLILKKIDDLGIADNTIVVFTSDNGAETFSSRPEHRQEDGDISTMSAWLISLLVFAIIFGGALLGVVLRPLLSESHLQPDSRDVVKMATGLIGTLAALVLGLLIASAKSSFDQKTSQVRQMTATIILLDDLLTQYGPEAVPLRTRLRQSIPPLADRLWHEQEVPAGKPVHFESSAQSLTFENELERLTPNNDAQRSLQSRAVQAFTEGAQTRLLLFAQSGGSIPAPFLIILVFWLSAIFVSFTLFARTNLVVMISLFVCALSFAGAIFPVLELDNPFTGLMGISSATLRSALLPLNP